MRDTTNMTLRSLTNYIFKLVMDRFPANKLNHINQYQLYEYIRNLLLQNTANAELGEYRDIFIQLFLNKQGKHVKVHHGDTTYEFVYDSPIEISEVDDDQIAAYTREFVRVLCLGLDKDTQTIFSKKLYASIIASHQQYIGIH